MISPALRVPRSQGERGRRLLKARGLLREDLRIERSEEWILLPVSAAEGPAPMGEWVTAEFPEPPGRRRPTSYRDRLPYPPELARALPRSFDVIGDLVVLRLPESLQSRSAEIAEAIRSSVPRARLVGVDRGVKGPFRLRDIGVVAGTGPLRTRHRENGIELDVDLARAYFSPRLAREHDLVARAARPGERILDLCCGMGPFALTLAVRDRSRSITAVDLNPEAIALLRENAERLGVGDRILALCADAADHLRHGPTYDRAILNLPHAGAGLLAPLSDRIVPGGTVHYYEIVPREQAAARPVAIAGGMRPGAAWTVVGEHVVHEYSPTSDLRGYTLRRSAASEP